MKITTDPKKIEEILTRGVEDVFVESDLRKKLSSGERLRIKFGIDPTGPTVHLGRAVPLRKLRALQDLGHKVVLIVGDFTAQIGDPSDKLEKRPMLTKEAIKKNLKNYKKILGKIIDVSKAEFVYNSSWLAKLKFQEIAELSESFTVQQMSNRRNFKERFEKGEEVSLREFLYPLMQGYDSVAVKSDVEIGGFDQLFNLKAGRVVQRHYGMAEQDVLTTMMLEGTDGRKMSTSWGNVITITDEPNDMFGKIMALRDELIGKYFLLTTDRSIPDIQDMEKRMKEGSLNPRDAKIELARELVRIYHGLPAAESAEEYFISTFQKKEIPEDIPSVSLSSGDIAEILIKENIIVSKTDLRRLLEQGAITELTEDRKVETIEEMKKQGVYRIGKKRFIKVTK